MSITLTMVADIVRQLTMLKAGELAWQQVPEPDLAAHEQALVRPLAVATCDLDWSIVTGQTPMRGPIAPGHERVGEVLATGSAVTDFAAGDVVVVPFQISCGAC